MNLSRVLWRLLRFSYRLVRFTILFVGFSLILAFVVEQFLPSVNVERRSQNSEASAILAEGKLSDWDAGVYISLSALQSFADSYTGTHLTSQHGVPRALRFSARLLPSKFSFQGNELQGTVPVETSSWLPLLSLNLQADASLSLRDIRHMDNATDEDDRDKCKLIFGYVIERVSLRGSRLNALRNWYPRIYEIVEIKLGELATSRLGRTDKGSGEWLPAELPVEVPFRLRLPLAVDDKQTLPFEEISIGKKEGEKKKIGSVVLHKHMPKSEIVRYFEYRLPIVVNDGYLLVARVTEKDPRLLSRPMTVSAHTASDQDLAGFAPQLSDKPGFAIWLRKAALTSIATEITRLPLGKTTVTLQSISSDGRLSAVAGKDKTLGEFGVFLKMPDPRGLNGNVRISNLAFDPANLRLSGKGDATATAKLELQVKPPLLPRVDASFTVNASTEARIAGDLKMFVYDSTNAKKEVLRGAHWGLDFSCTVANLTGRVSNQKLFGAAPINIGNIDFVIPQKLFDEKSKASILMDGLPQRSAMIKAWENEADKAAETLLVAGPAEGLDISIVPSEVVQNDAGFMVKGNIIFAHAATHKPDKDKRRDDLRALKEVRFQGPQQCPETQPASVVIAGIDFVGEAKDIIDHLTDKWKELKAQGEAIDRAIKGDWEGASEKMQEALKAKFHSLDGTKEKAVQHFKSAQKAAEEFAAKPVDKAKDIVKEHTTPPKSGPEVIQRIIRPWGS